MVFPKRRRKFTEKDFIKSIVMYDRMNEFELVEHFVERLKEYDDNGI